MKNKVIILFFLLSFPVFSNAQEWLTSLDAAQRIALVQDKMIFMIWEEAAAIPYPVIMNDGEGNGYLFENFLENEEITKLIWENFVPVKVSEDYYDQLYQQAKQNRNEAYVAQLGDDNIKIMDANLHIVNVSESPEAYFNLSEFMTTYAMNTSFLKLELTNYRNRKDFGSIYRLASKYMDFAILVNEKVRPDIISLALAYADEADKFISDDDEKSRSEYEDKTTLLRLSQYLLKDRPKKVLRTLKRLTKKEIVSEEEPLVAYLYYTSFQLLKDSNKAKAWRDKVNDINLKKAELIRRMHL